MKLSTIIISLALLLTTAAVTAEYDTEYQKGIDLFDAGKLEEASSVFKRILDNSKDKSPRVSLAYAYACDKLATKLNTDTAYLQAMNAYKFYLDKFPVTARRTFAKLRYAYWLDLLGKNEAAVLVYSKLLARGDIPLDFRLHVLYSQALAFLKIKHHENARSNFQIIINKFQDSQEAEYALLWLADDNARSGKLKKAIELYKQFCGRFPKSKLFNSAIHNFASTLAEAGKSSQAKEVLLSKSPTPSGQVLLWTWNEFNKKSTPEVLVTTCLKAIAAEKNKLVKAELELKLAEFYQQQQNWQAALKLYPQVRESLSQISGDTLVTTEMYNHTYLAEAESLRSSKKFIEAESALKNLNVVEGGHNSFKKTLQQAVIDKNQNKIELAVLGFAKVGLFANDPKLAFTALSQGYELCQQNQMHKMATIFNQELSAKRFEALEK